MFDYDDEDERPWNRIEFSYRDECDGVRKTVEVNLADKETYTDIVEQFVYFLQSLGYTYIGGLVVLDQDGEEMHSTM